MTARSSYASASHMSLHGVGL